MIKKIKNIEIEALEEKIILIAFFFLLNFDEVLHDLG